MSQALFKLNIHNYSGCFDMKGEYRLWAVEGGKWKWKKVMVCGLENPRRHEHALRLESGF